MCTHWLSAEDESNQLHWPPDFSSSGTRRLKFSSFLWNIYMCTMDWLTDIHAPQRMDRDDLGDPLIYPLAPPAGWFIMKYWQ